ncbi:MAG: cytidine deaminase, partial [Silicimonas sp.]|nr:cytidine deaminase [Silicimonas sp.]
LKEFAAPGARIVMATTGGARQEMSVDALLPGAFGRDHMV